MKRITVLAATGLVSVALAACGSSNKSSGAATKSVAASSTPTTTAVSSTPTAVSSTPTATSTSAAGTSTTASVPMSLAAFKAAVKAQGAAAKQIGAALEKALQNAGKMTNATFASTFAALGQQFQQYAASFSQIHPPAKYAAPFDTIAQGYAKLALDVIALSHATTAAQSGAEARTLVKDASALRRPENTLGKELGLPNH